MIVHAFSSGILSSFLNLMNLGFCLRKESVLNESIRLDRGRPGLRAVFVFWSGWVRGGVSGAGGVFSSMVLGGSSGLGLVIIVPIAWPSLTALCGGSSLI